MWQIATGLLGLMLAVFLAARYLEAAYPALAWVRAFTEAAIVGALADWFAVTALFRHPLGLPIPHTAIVPRNKDRIGRNLAEFVERNFLAPGVVREKIANVDIVAAVARWIGEGDRPRKLAERIGDRLPGLLGELEAGEVRRYVQESVNEWMRGADLAPEVAGVISAIHFRSGEEVKAGTPLVQLNAAADIAQLESLKAAAELAELTYRRDQSQLKVQAVSQATVDTDAANLKVAKARVAQQHGRDDAQRVDDPATCAGFERELPEENQRAQTDDAVVHHRYRRRRVVVA